MAFEQAATQAADPILLLVLINLAVSVGCLYLLLRPYIYEELHGKKKK